MNIDTLRTNSGYRAARWSDIVRCLNADHVTHLQRGSDVLAFRPVDWKGERAWQITRAPNGISAGEKLFTEQLRAIRYALGFLNGFDNLAGFEAGDDCDIFANQAEREGTVLAVLGQEVLVEYVMPGTTSGRETSALRVVKALGCHITNDYVGSYPHRRLPRRWRNAMLDQGTTHWVGLGQREFTPVPFPTA